VTGPDPAVTESLLMAGEYALSGVFTAADAALVLQQHFVVFGVSSLVVAGLGAVLVEAAPS
jgi:hypothetical protein